MNPNPKTQPTPQQLSNPFYQQQHQLRQFYSLLQLNKQKDSLAQKSTLVSALIYNQVDKHQPQFFRYILRSLQKLPNSTITQDDFKRIFMTPTIDFSNVKEQDIADVKNVIMQMFIILDREKKGSISTESFLRMYKETESYAKIREDQRDKMEKDIKEYIKGLTFDGYITPNDFYKIIKFTEEND